MNKFLTSQEMDTVIAEYQLLQITASTDIVNGAILAAIAEATSYLNAKYDCQKIFTAEGDQRNILVLEHCKSIALYYIVRRSNADMYYDKVRDYYKNAKEWLERVAGVNGSGKQLAPDLPAKKSEDGTSQSAFRGDSLAKFSHHFQ